MAITLNLTGHRFGQLLVLSHAPNIGVRTAWLCRCDCGTETTKITKYLRNGDTTSCGCAGKHVCEIRHGLYKISEYNIWKRMRSRCNRLTAKDYPRYGGRGIKVCQRWDSFAIFLSDMGRRPSDDHSVERKNNNGDYDPENCIWATDAQQRRNKRTSVILIRPKDNKRMNIKDWARELNVTPATIHRRLRNGWSLNDALDPAIKNPHLRYLTFNNKTQTMSEWARTLGVRVQVLGHRLNSYHWSIERALSTPIKHVAPEDAESYRCSSVS